MREDLKTGCRFGTNIFFQVHLFPFGLQVFWIVGELSCSKKIKPGELWLTVPKDELRCQVSPSQLTRFPSLNRRQLVIWKRGSGGYPSDICWWSAKEDQGEIQVIFASTCFSCESGKTLSHIWKSVTRPWMTKDDPEVRYEHLCVAFIHKQESVKYLKM